MKNRAVFKLIMMSIAIGCGLSSCNSDEDGGSTNDFTATPISLTSDESSIVNNVNDYSLALFSKVNADYQRFNNGNVFISPLSSEFALAMTANGADGNTLTEILTALNGGNTTLGSINSLNKKLITGLPKVFSGITFDIANSIWADNAFPIYEKFITDNEDTYRSCVSNLDFGSSQASSTINSWVSDATRGKITDIVSDISSLDAVYLINTIYFKGAWSTPFDNTKIAPFTNYDLSAGSAQYMTRTANLKYAETDKFALAEVPYSGGSFVMDIIMSSDIADLDTFDANVWTALIGNLSYKRTEITMPHFNLTNDCNLVPYLSQLGINDAFDKDKSDFSKMSAKAVFINKVLQKATITVDAEGTVATTATSVEIKLGDNVYADDPLVFNVNRPFIFVIREAVSGTIVFVGEIRNLKA